MSKLICGDAGDWLRKNEPVDLIITDPDYDLSDEEKKYYLARMQWVSKGQVILFCKPENQWPTADQYLAWVKPVSTKNTSKSYARFFELILIYGEGHWNTERHWSQYNNVFHDLVDDIELHPFRKPPSLIERLILNHSRPGDLILDPFAGSCVVGEMAHRHGREFICIEKEDKYLRAASQRIWNRNNVVIE